MMCRDLGDRWVCEFSESDMLDKVFREGLRGLYDMILRHTINKGYDELKGYIVPWRIKTSEQFGHELAKILQTKYGVSEGSLEFANHAPSSSKEVRDNTMVIYKDAIKEEEPEMELM